jgi:hypothetical protein
VPSALRALLTSPYIVKVGLGIKQILLDLSTAFEGELLSPLKSNTTFIDLGQYAKLKGTTADSAATLDNLAGHILKKQICASVPPSNIWSPEYVTKLHQQVDCIWQLYSSLQARDSVGLPLIPWQSEQDGHLVMVYQASKPIAEGKIIWPKPPFIEAVDDEEGRLRKIKVTPSRSLVEITRVLVPGALVNLHSQCLDWIFNHGNQLVVKTSTLRTRSLDPAAFSSSGSASQFMNSAFSVPAPMLDLTHADIPPFNPCPPHVNANSEDPHDPFIGGSLSEDTDLEGLFDDIAFQDGVDDFDHESFGEEVCLAKP